MLLLDTDVLIDYLRDRGEAVRYFEGLLAPTATSAVTVAELYAGVRNAEEEAAVESLLSTLHIFEIDAAIAKRAGLFRRKYLRSHQVEIPDALIAATSAVHEAQLVTLNRRHYPMLPRVLVPYRKSA